MGARSSKSKKPSAGSGPSPSPPEELVLYLDENLCNSKAILDTLKTLNVRFERHLGHFLRGTTDETWLPLVGERGWALLTCDKQIRYNLLEKRALEKHAVREFAFVSGNLSGQEMADVLASALPKIQRLCRRFKPPFVAAITRSGEVHIRWPKRNPDQSRSG